MRRIDVPVLVVGAGGAGLAAGIFLADLGVEALVIERHPGTANLPKAHYVNQRSMEIFRQHGLADAIYSHAAPRHAMGSVYWLTSLGGDGPLDRMVFHKHDALGAGPGIRADYDAKGVTPSTNIPQIRLEPVLQQVLEERGGAIRFQHELVGFEQDESGVTALVRDLEAGEDIEVRCSWLVGADAGKTVGPASGIQTVRHAGDHNAHLWAVVWIAADLSSYIEQDDAVMRFIFHPEHPDRMGGLLTFGPDHWDGRSEEWTVGFTLDPSTEHTDESIFAAAKEFLNVDVPIELRKITTWRLETRMADRFRSGRVIVIGDAAHQHPPMAGLGLNSAFQDAHNLAWKLALVLGGQAPQSLLDSFEAERRPVVAENTEWSLFSAANYQVLLSVLGASPGTPPQRAADSFKALLADTRTGRARRALAEEVFGVQRIEYAAHDMEMGFGYTAGALADDGSPPAWRDPMGSEYRPTTRPGHRLPHAWLEAGGQRVSTHDLIPPRGLLLLTGPSGNAWHDAAEKIAVERRVAIRTVRIGVNGDATDPTGGWAQVREIEDDGAVLVRPDAHVGFRARTAVDDHQAVLADAVVTILEGGRR